MKKIFLCHSSCDKEYLKIVARKLGRARIIFDKLSFTPGQDFRKAIKEGIGAASFFVFFASSNSLKSLWCKFEIDQALFTKTGRNIDNFLTIIIDRDTRLSDLPRWMQLTKAVIQTRPSQATRDIQHALFLIYPQQIQKPYIGREQLHQELTTNILDLNGVQKRLFVVSGLEGIGRRTYLKHACRDIWIGTTPTFFYI